VKESIFYLTIGIICLVVSFYVETDTFTIFGIISLSASAILAKIHRLEQRLK